MVRLRVFFVAFIVFILSTQNSFAIPVDAENIPSDKYFETTLNEITNAKSSVLVVMYLISSSPNQPDSQPNQLVNALIKAKDRGLDVKVILDQTLDFSDADLDNNQISQNKNEEAFLLLKKYNVPVFFDEAQTFTHAKAIIFDNETVILGSTNWSIIALTRNNEANVLIHSKDFAANLLSDFSKIKLQEYIPPVVTPSVPIPKDFLMNKNLLGEMISQSDDRAFDTYLYILSQYNGNPDLTLTLNYDKLADSLGINTMSKEDYRRQINKVLEKLQDKYNLIKFQNPARNQDAMLTLAKNQNSESFNLPTIYWNYNWNKTLALPAKTMYLINLFYTEHTPSWFMSRETLSKTFNISESFISDGTMSLRKLNLLEVKYGSLEDNSYDKRKANVYAPQPLYDPNELKQELQDLETKYTKEKVTRAIATAAVIFEENNLQTIQALIELEDKYGQAIIQEAAKQIGDKNPENPLCGAPHKGFYVKQTVM